MFCCLGLFAGFAAGAVLGGPWSFLAPAAGFGLGLIGDMMLLKHGLHGTHKNTESKVHMREHELHHEEPEKV